MDFGVQVLAAVGIACIVGLPIAFYLYKKYRREGRSIKYLEFKIAIVVGLPIVSIPFLLSDKLTIVNKLLAIILMLISGIIYAYAITSGRKTFRKIIGLSPEDEHTGEVIKDKGKTKED